MTRLHPLSYSSTEYPIRADIGSSAESKGFGVLEAGADIVVIPLGMEAGTKVGQRADTRSRGFPVKNKDTPGDHVVLRVYCGQGHRSPVV